MIGFDLNASKQEDRADCNSFTKDNISRRQFTNFLRNGKS
jgi:hypothetical protein